MKSKTARRRLRSNQWKVTKARVYATLRETRGLGKKWKLWTRVAMSK